MTETLRNLGLQLRQTEPQRRRQIAAIILGVGLVSLLLLPSMLTNEYQIIIARDGFFFAILASSWALLAGISGQFSFAHMAFMVIGAYGAGLLGRDGFTILGLTVAGGDIHPFITIIFGTLVTGVFGLIIGVLVLRLRAAYLALFTIAFAELVRVALETEFDYTGGSNGLGFRPLFEGRTTVTGYYILFGLLVASLVFMYIFANSRFGMFLRAMREDEEAAAAMGVDIVRYKVVIFVITSMIVGLAGGVYYHEIGRVTPNAMQFLNMALVIAYAVIGGMESLMGAAVGAFISRIIIESLREFTLPFGLSLTIGELTIGPKIAPGEWRFAVFGLVLVLTLRFARNGLFHPLLYWFSARDVALKATISKREARPQPEEASGD